MFGCIAFDKTRKCCENASPSIFVQSSEELVILRYTEFVKRQFKFGGKLLIVINSNDS